MILGRIFSLINNSMMVTHTVIRMKSRIPEIGFECVVSQIYRGRISLPGSLAIQNVNYSSSADACC